MRLKEVNYYGLMHDKINEKFTGDLTYLRTFTVRGHHWAVYLAANPRTDLGHKKYMMLGCTYDLSDMLSDPKPRWFVSGSTEEQMNEERFQSAVLCTECDTVLYSINRHHFHKCGCKNETFVDGGKDYLRYGGAKLSKIKKVEIDLVEGTLTEIDGVPIMPSDRVKLEVYSHSGENPDAKLVKGRRSSHSGENKKRSTTRHKSGKVKSGKRVGKQ